MNRLPVAIYVLGAAAAAAVAAFDASTLRNLSSSHLLHPDFTAELWRTWARDVAVWVVLPVLVAVLLLRSSSPPARGWSKLAGPLVWALGVVLALLPRTFENDGWFNYAPNAGVLVDDGALVRGPGAFALALVGLSLSAVVLLAGRGRPEAEPA